MQTGNPMTIQQVILDVAKDIETKDADLAQRLRVAAENPKDCNAEQFVRLYLQHEDSPLNLFNWML